MIDLERPRLQQFHDDIAAAIPCVPEEIRSDLYAMALPTLLGVYVNWRDRFIPPRPREVGIWEGFFRHGRGHAHIEDARRIQEMIRRGDDLTPLLSRLIRKAGYVRPNTDESGKRRGIEWGDKDFALNVHDVHHLHLGMPGANGGRAKRTKELLFVMFRRAYARILMVGDHNSFDDGSLAAAIAEVRVALGETLRGVTAEDPGQPSWKQRSTLTRRGINMAVSIEGKVVMSSMLSAAGTAMTHGMYASDMMRHIDYYELRIDDDNTGREWAAKAGRPYPDKPEFRWSLQNCDLGIIEETTQTFYSLVRWRR